MRKQVEILIYQYKKRNNLDVFSALEWHDRDNLLISISNCIDRIETKTRSIDEERIMPNESNV